MKANELRIGNLIEINAPIMDKIIVVDVYHISELKKNKDFFQPIPLTEEWLLKFGFNKQIDGFFRKNNSFMIEVLFHDEGFCVTNQGVILNHILYLHQLQNLYFALTGTELTLNK